MGSPAEQVFVVEFNEPVGIAVFKELGAVQAAFGNRAHQLAHVQVVIAEQGLGSGETLAGHEVLLTEHLLINSPDDGVLILCSGDRPVFLITIIGKTLNAELG